MKTNNNVENVSEYDKGYAGEIAGHLADNYDKGHWDYNPDWKCDSNDYRSLEKIYYNTVSDTKRKYQKKLNSLMLKYLRLEKLKIGENRINFSKFVEILYYKTIYRSKKVIRNFLYE